jgi:class 3 adenylate cyclase
MVVGDSVNVPPASRPPRRARSRLDEATHDAVRDVVVMQDLGNLRLDGKSDWVRAFSVIALERTEPDGRPALEVPSARD